MSTPASPEMPSLGADTSREEGTKEPGTVVIPIREEHLEIERRLVEHGRVAITKHVQERTERVEMGQLWNEDVRIERIAKDEIVERIPEPRYEGDVLILSMVEEILVVEKRLRLREEVRVTRTWTPTSVPAQEFTLRSETVEVERISVEPDAPGESSSPTRS